MWSCARGLMSLRLWLPVVLPIYAKLSFASDFGPNALAKRR